MTHVSSDYIWVKTFSPELLGQNLLRINAFGPLTQAGAADSEGRRTPFSAHLSLSTYQGL